jgi:hypothetical protein
LLETGFLALVMAPWRLWSRPSLDPPRPVMLWLARWLLFRLLIASAAVKLTSGDPHWSQLTALDYHYWTQPIPPPIAYTFAHFPEMFQKISTLVMFFIEGVVPFFPLRPASRVSLPWAPSCSCSSSSCSRAITVLQLPDLALCVCWLDDGRPAQPGAPSHRQVGTSRGRRGVVVLSLIPFWRPLSRSAGLRRFSIWSASSLGRVAGSPASSPS